MKTGETEFKAERSALMAATVAVAVTYVYFLLFAEFALLELAKPLTDGTDWRLRGLMTSLGAGGVVGSALAAWRCHLVHWQKQLSWGFRACAVAAALALSAASWGMWLVVAGLVGVSLGWLTVILVSGLRATVGTARLGMVAGVGTGLAYALCNLPGVFDASARTQTIVVAFLAGAGSLLAPFLTPQEPSVSLESDYKFLGFGRWLLILLLLVWLDSAAFYVIQHEAGLQAATWAGTGRLLANALIHLLMAVAAGWWLDWGGRMAPIAIALVLLAAGCLTLVGGPASLASLCYAAGVSLYSVVLVYYPARSGRSTQAGIVFAVAGWLGSALGIGMAQNLHAVPVWFLGLAGGLVALMGGWRWLVQRGGAVTTGLAILVGLTLEAERAEAAAPADALVLRGREVYIGEGCIHCHSQHIRPGTTDVERWGDPVASDGSPPLYGNRRQGPDLSTVGQRLPLADWHREHLKAPRTLIPGSRMPSYAYLFEKGGDRGEALVAYLLSLGTAHQEIVP